MTSKSVQPRMREHLPGNYTHIHSDSHTQTFTSVRTAYRSGNFPSALNSFIVVQEVTLGNNETAQHVMVLATKPQDPSSIPSYTWYKERSFHLHM